MPVVATAVVATAVVATVTGGDARVVDGGVMVLVVDRSLESRKDRYDRAPAASNIRSATIHAGEILRRRL